MVRSAEEAEIHRALEPIAGVHSLSFQLGARTLGIDAVDEAYAAVLEAIRRAGFAPEPIVTPETVEADARRSWRSAGA